jgi:RNA polymerase sigma factor (sigma-70 family)
MPDAQDMDLVRRFVRDHSDAAFAELVRRHLNLVYSVARRCTGNDEDAQDLAQAVFIILARKSAGLSPKTLLPGWLYETTRFTAARLLRANARRRAREQEAYMQSTLNQTDTADVWERLAPHLENAMSHLAAGDRALLVLRFYQNKTGPEAAALLCIRENTLHKRVARALGKLRMFFTKQGVTLSGEAIADAISANSLQMAPAGLAAAVTAAAKGATASTSILSLAQGTGKTMAGIKLKIATVCALGLVGVVTIVGSLSIHQPQAPARAATLGEIRQLFTLATNRPARCEIEADIETITPPYTKAQVEAALLDIKKFMHDANARLTPQKELEWEFAQSNAIVQAHSGKRIEHVREWFSGNYSRLDVNDEGAEVENFVKTHPGEYRNTFVSIPHSPFSPYSSYTINRELRDFELFKNDQFGWLNLEQALGMDADVAGAILPPLIYFQMKLEDPAKARRLAARIASNWRLEVTDETLNGRKATHFSFGETGVFQADVWVAHISGKTVCLLESTTNFTEHTSTISEREQFDEAGMPARWTISTWARSSMNATPTPEVKSVVFKRIDLKPTLTEEEVFAPVFPPGYIVSDLSSGHGVILQNPHPEWPVAK